MDDTKPKDNANPVIHKVNRHRKSSTQERKSSGQHGIDRIANVSVMSKWAPTSMAMYDDQYLDAVPTPVERSIYMALRDIKQVHGADSNKKNKHNGNKNNIRANEDCIKVLQDAGFFIDENIDHGCSKRSGLEIPFYLPLSMAIEDGEGISDRCQTERLNDDSIVVVERDPFDSEEVFDMIRTINDPEHPLTLEELRVVSEEDIRLVDHFAMAGKGEKDSGTVTLSTVEVLFTPTIPHCSMATLIGLCLRVKLLRSLPSRFKVAVKIKPGMHASEQAINKQLADKERVAAALENQHLLGVVNKCISRLD